MQINDETVVTSEFPLRIRHTGGDWAGYFDTAEEAEAWAAQNPNNVFPGMRVTIAGESYRWR